ncbi:MAG: hypothetical protein GY817_05110 [bacterium]|nr:hypothetical protein [bacterium]
MSKQKILITTGDPQGIGPEVSVKAATFMQTECEPILIGSRANFKSFQGEFIHVDGGSYEYLKKAVEILTNRPKVYKRLVTAPISKVDWQEADVPYPAHTEALAGLTGISKYAMVFANSKARVVLATRHIPLEDIPQFFTRKALEDAIDIGVDFLEQLGIKNKRIGICSLNPHGDENCEVNTPNILFLRKYQNLTFIGPTSGDALFQKAVDDKLDLIIAAYHDQGIFPLKAMDYYRCVNITVGLPFIRVSPGHGTATDIAGQGVAKCDAMVEAIRWSLRL